MIVLFPLLMDQCAEKLPEEVPWALGTLAQGSRTK